MTKKALDNRINKKAVTLLEIIVAAVILSLVLAGMAAVFIAGKRHVIHSRAKITASELGRYFLDPLHMQVRQDTWNNSCLGTGTPLNCPDQAMGVAQGLDTDYTAQYSVTPNFNGTTLSKAKVTLRWNEVAP